MQNDALICFTIFQAVFLLLDIFIWSRVNRSNARKGEMTAFCALIVVHLAYLVLNSLWSLEEYDVLNLPRPWMTALCACSLTSLTGCAFAFFCFTIERIRLAPLATHRGFALSALPAALSTALIASSPWTGWVYSISEANRMVHGPLYLVMVFSSSLYLLGAALIGLHKTVTARTAHQRQSGAAMLSSVLLILLFVAIDSLLSHASILPAAVFAVIVVIFINLQESNINSDALTGMNNRRKADEFLAGRLGEVSEENPLYLFMGDLNSFKGINDVYGHLEGDAALILCATALKRTIGRFGGFAARYGGDEFLLSCQPGRGRSFDPDTLVDAVNRELFVLAEGAQKPYSLTMSLGYTRCTDRRKSLAACIREADEMLYQRKAAYHGK